MEVDSEIFQAGRNRSICFSAHISTFCSNSSLSQQGANSEYSGYFGAQVNKEHHCVPPPGFGKNEKNSQVSASARE